MRELSELNLLTFASTDERIKDGGLADVVEPEQHLVAIIRAAIGSLSEKALD